MKHLVISIAILFTFSFCTASCGKNEAPTPQNNDNPTPNPSTTKMKITVGTTVFTATLYNNASANAFRAMLPLTLDMTELNNNEKYYDFPSSLRTNAAVGGAIKLGDLTLYGNNTLVLFYKNFNTSYSYTKLGFVDNPARLADALGTGNVVIKFENN